MTNDPTQRMPLLDYLWVLAFVVVGWSFFKPMLKILFGVEITTETEDTEEDK